MPIAIGVQQSILQGQRKIANNGLDSDSSFIGLHKAHSTDAPSTGPGEEDITNEDELERLRQRMPVVREKSGELVRPVLRPSSARRQPSSMVSTSPLSKAVRFDSHLEHVRHFFQVDMPLAVSVNSSPTEAYDGESENSRNPQIEWEIVISNFPTETPQRLSHPVRVERVFLSSGNMTLVGSVAVANLAFHKAVIARFTLDYWKTTSDVVAEFVTGVRLPEHADGYDRFNFNIKLADQANLEAKTLFFCVKYCVNGQEYWDNNSSANFQIHFRKNPKQHNSKKDMQGVSSRPLKSILRSNKKSPPATSGRPESMSATLDDFADGSYAKYKFNDSKKHANSRLGESSTSVRLKGVKSAVSLTSDSLTRRAPSTIGQAFGNRYDFGTSLSAAIQAVNNVQGNHGGLTSIKLSTKKQGVEVLQGAPDTASQVSMMSSQDVKKTTISSRKKAPLTSVPASVASGIDSSLPTGSGVSVLDSQLYSQLLETYCFVRTYEFHHTLRVSVLINSAV
jgi:hypothetical protein